MPADREKIAAFLDRFLELASGATTIGLLAVADRTGLSHYLGTSGPATAAEIARGAGLELRYVEEILSGLAAAGVLGYEPGTGAFSLPPEHALFISDESSPYFMGGFFDMLPTALAQVDGIADATVNGGGVSFEDFGPRMISGIDRGNTPSLRAFLLSRWLPAVPGLIDRLETGIRVADIGCGAGTAVTLIAGSYPRSTVTGFEISHESLALARSRSEGMWNVEFVEKDVADIPIDPPFDLITSFDVIHDLTSPLAGLRRVRSALTADGMCLMMEPNAGPRLEDNLTPRGAMLYGISVLHCMTQSLARGGAGLGAAWGGEAAETMAREAGFSSFERLEDITNRFSAFYLLRP
jgi:SAM-dependent methyltransferase